MKQTTVMLDSNSSKGRILCVTSNFPRWKGDSTTPFVLHLAQDLQELGWTVDVLAPHAENGTASEEIIDGVRVERFSYLWPKTLQTVCYHGGALVNLRAKPLNFLKLPALVFFEWLAILRRLANGRYDVLHSHWIVPQGFVGVLAAKLLGVPHLVTVHGGDVFALNTGLLRVVKRLTLRHANVVSVNSSVTRSAVEQLTASLPSIKTIPMGVVTDTVDKTDPRVTAVRTRYCRDGGSLIMFLGRIVEEKGVEDLIKATALLRGVLPKATVVIVGDGQDKSKFEALTHTMGLSDCIVFTGWVDPIEVPSHLAAADVFVGPSRTAENGWIEAQGLTFLEAMVARTPVVATRSGGIVDSVVDEETGLLVSERSPDQIANCILRLHHDPELCTALTNRAYDAVVAKFSRSASASSFERVLEDLRLSKLKNSSNV